MVTGRFADKPSCDQLIYGLVSD